MFGGVNRLSFYPWLVFSVTATGTFMATLDASIVNVALPVIANSLRVDLHIVQWVVVAYLLAISSLLPLFGRMGDMFGRRTIYLWGFILFTVGSFFCGEANSIWILIAARVFQAVGAAMLMSIAPAIVSSVFPGRTRGRALGMVGAIVALGTMTGPGLGGILVGIFGWKSIFFVNIPVGILGYFAGTVLLPINERQRGASFDFPGAILFSVGIFSLMLVISHGREWGWLSTSSVVSASVAIVALLLFVRQETKADQPMIDLSLFQNWPYLAGTLSAFLSFMCLFVNSIMLPFYLHDVLELSPVQIGLLITPFPFVLAFVAPISGYMSEKMNLIALTTGGLAITAMGLLSMLFLDGGSSLIQVAVGQAILGLGNGLFQSPNNNSVLSAAPPSKLGLASGINALVRNLGMICGAAMAISVFETFQQRALEMDAVPGVIQQQAAFLTGFHAALIMGLMTCFCGILISLNRKGYVMESK